jgi:arylsulfatase A-like enzyme
MIARTLTLGLVVALAACRGKPLERAARIFGDDEPVERVRGGGQPTVLFVVLDTVRADHMGVCGYNRPNTPYLEHLVKDVEGVSFTCGAHAPGPWTVPSHASYFTGLQVPEHGSDRMGLVFPSHLPTLAEKMKEKGFQSVMLTANPTLSELSGLQRGFDLVRRPKTLTEIRKDTVKDELKSLLDQADPERPLFLFVNLLDAHDPYPRVPEGVGWVPAQPQLIYDVHDKQADAPYHRYFNGQMPDDRKREYERVATNGYDYGIFLDDQNVKEVLRTLRKGGWMENGFRLVLTSDHGEFLGEHGMLRHGCWIWEPVTNVPFLYFDSNSRTPVDLSPPFTALHAWDLLLEGALPEPRREALSFSNFRPEDIKQGADMAALWTSATEKLVWWNDAYHRLDLRADPLEASPTPLPADHPKAAALATWAAAHRHHLDATRNQAIDPALKQQLMDLGYWEGGEGDPAGSPGAPAATPPPAATP